MSYTVFARKYRPQTFGELVGQDHVAKTIANAIASGRVAHAFLFTGVRGVGKTTMARLLAKSLCCEQGPTAEPCNQCSPCRDITAGVDMDVLEIDGASNNSVDDVRRLQESLPYRPSRNRFKIVIVDEVHMLSQGAFNAFLKTLEEPPPHVKFVFATTESHKVPVTIRSRCQRYDFRLIPQSVVAGRVRDILAAEGIEADDGAVAIVAREAAGSMRDALTLLDQLVAFAGTRLEGENVARTLGIADRKQVFDAARACLEGDGAAALRAVDALARQGADMLHCARQLLELVRDLVVLRVSGQDSDLVDLVEEERSQASDLAEATDALELQRVFTALSKLVDDVGRSGAPKTVLEMGLVRIATRPPIRSVSELVARLEALERSVGGGPRGGGSPGRGRGSAPRGRGGASGSRQVSAEPSAPSHPRGQVADASGPGPGREASPASPASPSPASPSPASPSPASQTPASPIPAGPSPARQASPSPTSPSPASPASPAGAVPPQPAAIPSLATPAGPAAGTAVPPGPGVATAPSQVPGVRREAGMAPAVAEAEVTAAAIARPGPHPHRNAMAAEEMVAEGTVAVRAPAPMEALAPAGQASGAPIATVTSPTPASPQRPVERRASEPGASPAHDRAPDADASADPAGLDEAQITAFQRIVERLHDTAPMHAAVVRHGAPISVTREHIVVGFEAGSFYGRQAQASEVRDALAAAAAGILGGDRPTIEVRLAAAASARRPTIAMLEAQEREDRRREVKEKALKHPRVIEALQIFPEGAGTAEVHVDKD